MCSGVGGPVTSAFNRAEVNKTCSCETLQSKKHLRKLKSFRLLHQHFILSDYSILCTDYTRFFFFALVGYKSPELWMWSLAGIIRGVLWVWIDPINFFTTGVGWWCDWSSAGGMVCLSPRCEPDRDYARAWADKRDTQNKVMMFGSVLRECHLYVWGKPSAAYPLLINRLALTGALSPSFLIISARLHQRNSLISHLKHTFISPTPPPTAILCSRKVRRISQPTAEWALEGGREATVERQSTDHNGWPITSGKGGWGAGRRGRL